MHPKILTNAIVFGIFLFISSGYSAKCKKYCSECEEEVWEEIPCEEIITTTTAPPTRETPPTTPLPIPTVSTPAPYVPLPPEPYVPPPSPSPPTLLDPPVVPVILPKKTIPSDGGISSTKSYKKCYCECKVGCKEFCRKVVIENDYKKRVTKISKTQESVPYGHIETQHLHDRKFIPSSISENNYPINYYAQPPPPPTPLQPPIASTDSYLGYLDSPSVAIQQPQLPSQQQQQPQIHPYPNPHPLSIYSSFNPPVASPLPSPHSIPINLPLNYETGNPIYNKAESYATDCSSENVRSSQQPIEKSNIYGDDASNFSLEELTKLLQSENYESLSKDSQHSVNRPGYESSNYSNSNSHSNSNSNSIASLNSIYKPQQTGYKPSPQAPANSHPSYPLKYRK